MAIPFLSPIGNINISDGTPQLKLTDTSSSATTTLTLDGVNLTLQNSGTDGDFTIVGKDGSSNINMLVFDTSDAGAATFYSGITTGGGTGGNSGPLTINGGITQTFQGTGGTNFNSHANSTTASASTDASSFLISQKNTSGTAIEYRQGVIADGNAYFGTWQSGSITGMGLNVATGNVTFSGTVTWSGGGSANANTAYGWGNHASAGYLTSVPATIALSTSSTTGYVLRLTDTGVADYDFTFPDTNTIKLSTDTTSNKTLKLDNAGSGRFDLEVTGNFTRTGRLEITGDVRVIGATDFHIPTGRKLCLDGGGTTYLTESSDGVIDFYGDGVKLFTTKQNGTQSEVVVNENSGDVDFRVEANNESHAFFVEAEGTGKVGIGTDDPSRPLSVHMASAGSISNFLHYEDSSNFSGLYISVSHDDNLVTLNASGSHGATWEFQNGNNTNLTMNSALATFEGIVAVKTGKAFRLYNAAGNGWAESTFNETDNKVQFNRGIQPSGNNQADQTLGISTKRWHTLYAGAGNFSGTATAAAFSGPLTGTVTGTATGLAGTPAISVGNITTTGTLYGPASFTIDPATHGNNTGTVVIAGNLQVDGTTTTINSTTVAIDDLNFSIATDAADSAAANGAGITIGGASATLLYTHATASWDVNKHFNILGGKASIVPGSGGYDQLKIVNVSTDNTNKLAGIYTLNYQNNNTSIMQFSGNNGGNTVYYGSADGNYRGITKHTFYVTTTGSDAVNGHTEAFKIESDLDATFMGGLSIGGGAPTHDELNVYSGGTKIGGMWGTGSGGYGKLNLRDAGNQQILLDAGTGSGTFERASSGNATLTIKTTTGGDPTVIFNSAAANRSGLIQYQDNGTNIGRIEYVHNGDKLRFQAGSSTGQILELSNSSATIAGDIIATGADMSVAHASGPELSLRRDDTSTGEDDRLGQIQFQADDPTDGTFNTGAAIIGKAGYTWGTNAYPGYLLFQTRDTSGGLITALTLDRSQNATFAKKIAVGGASQVTNSGVLDVQLDQTNGTLGAANTAHFGKHGANTSGQISGITLGYKENGNANYRKLAIVSEGRGDGAARQNLHLLVNTQNGSNSASLADSALKLDGLTRDATFTGNLTIPEYIYHTGDTDTYLRFETNNVVVAAGGAGFTQWKSDGDIEHVPVYDDTNQYIILGRKAGSNSGSSSGDNPVHHTILAGYSVDWSGGTRLSNEGFLIWNSGGGWTGNQRFWAMTNAYDMGGGPKFGLLQSTNNSTVPTLGSNGAVGTDTRLVTYWDKDKLMYHDGSATFASQVKSLTGWFTDNVYLSGGQLYIGASGANATTNDSHRLLSTSGAFKIQSRESGTWTDHFTISTTGVISGNGSGLTGVTSEWDGTLTGTAVITGDLKVTGSSEDLLTIASQAAGSGTYIISLNAAENAYEPIRIDAETFKVTASGGTSPCIISTSGLSTSFGGDVIVGSGDIHAQNGTVTNPSITFNSDPDLGIYRNTTNQMTLVAAGEAVGTVHSGGIQMHDNDIDYVHQLHFNDNVRFYDDGNDSYLNFKFGDTSFGGIKMLDGSGNTHGYFYADGDDSIGILDSGGSWAVQVDNDVITALKVNDTYRVKAHTSGVDLGCSSASDKVRISGHLGIGSNTSYPKIAYPGSNALWGGSGSTTGQIVIDLPGTLANYDMAYIEIDIYEYSGDAATKLIIGGHNWNSGGNSGTSNTQWHNVNVQVVGRLTKSVYLGRRNDGSNERRCIAIGETNSTWSYATVHVAKVHGAEFYSTAIDWVGDWNIAQTTSGSYFTASPATNFNDGGSYTLETNGIVQGKHTYGTVSARSPIFYDLDDTNYYVNPASGSVLKGDLTLGVSSANSTATIYGNTNNLVLRSQASGTRAPGLKFNINGTHVSGFTLHNNTGGIATNTLAYDVTGTNKLYIFSDGGVQSEGKGVFGVKVQGPIFYDSTSTNYYVDPASNSVLAGTLSIGASANGLAFTAHGDGNSFITVNHSGNENWYFKAASASGSTDYIGIGATGGGEVKIYEDGKLEHQGLNSLSNGTSVDQVKSYNMTFQLSADTWTDTGIDGTDLITGTWVMQCYVNDYGVGGSHYHEYYSATMSWYSSQTNESTHPHDEIHVHRAGHAPNDGHVQFRTVRGASANLKLQVKHNESYSAALDNSSGKQMQFSFRRLI